MYRAFNLTCGSWDACLRDDVKQQLIDLGRGSQKAHGDLANSILESLLNNTILNGKKLSQHWFPPIKADVFISHSHLDQEEALKLAGMLESVMGLSSFIDSCVWGHAEDLLRIIDNKYCLQPDGEHYNYLKRNDSTSHVHMMLSTALSTMLDSTECVFFLNTPNSITSKEAVDKTRSPWLFFELGMVRVIRLQKPERLITESHAKKAQMERLDIEYDAQLDELTVLDKDQLVKWMQARGLDKSRESHPLDLLYKLAPPT
jgi:hypothetical protein